MKKKTFLNALFFGLCAILIHSSAMSQNVDIKLLSEKQRIRGFGGMIVPKWFNNDLTDEQTDVAFGNGDGQLGLTILRMDLSHNYDQWSLSIHTARRAISHGAIVFASPWTPPKEMKTNNNIVGGKLKKDSYSSYANHLKTYYNYMNANGVPLYAISIQNEPDYTVSYDSCHWSIEEFKTFLDNNASVIPTKVMGPETIHAKDSWQNSLESSPELDILATHGYGGPANRHLTTNKEQWMTEHYTPNSDADSADRWPEALLVGEEINEYMVDGYSAYVWWYIAKSYGLVHKVDINPTPTKRGYVMGHYSKFVRPGSVRVDATETPINGVTTSAYKRGDSLVVVAINNNKSAKNITLNLNGTKVGSMAKYETTSSSNINNVGNLPGGTSISNTLAGYSISTFVGKISNANLGLENEIDKIDEILMHPNPVSEILSIYLPGNENKPTTLSVYNTNGSLIKTIIAKNGENKVDIKKLTNGLYFVVFNLNNKVYSRKFVKE